VLLASPRSFNENSGSIGNNKTLHALYPSGSGAGRLIDVDKGPRAAITILRINQIMGIGIGSRRGPRRVDQKPASG
jgi:hypothetical protein